MQKHIVITLSMCLFFLAGSPSRASGRATHFGTCFSEDGARIANGNWYWFEMGRAPYGGWRYGGSYVTSTRRIDKSDYNSNGKGYLTVTGKKLKNTDGTWVEGFYLPITMLDAICY